MKTAIPPAALLLGNLFSLAGCSLSGSGARPNRPADYVGTWATPSLEDPLQSAVTVNDDGTFTLSHCNSDDCTYDEGTWSSPSPGDLELDGQQSWSATMVPGCELLVFEYEAVQRDGAPTTCSMPADALSDAETCMLGGFDYSVSSTSPGLGGFITSENDTVTLDASRTYVFASSTYQNEQLTEGWAVGGCSANSL